ncbi:MAG: hypothetical protein DYG92_11550 [Leptolyngbya sp. PLA1]|nr:hypothetical protein [Leptolyngbya sp. PLA1]
MHIGGLLARVMVAVVVVTSLTLSSGCKRDLPRDTPEATLASARKVVADGRADLLGDFLYADTPEMRRLWTDAGIVMGNLQDLAKALQTRFPDEVAKLRADAEASAKAGKPTGLMAQLAGQVRGGRPGRPNPQQMEQNRGGFEDALTSLFVDPYAWLESAEGRLTTEEVDDETVAVLWDGKPVFAPLGLTMRQGQDENWYFVVPTGIPGVRNFMPKTPEQYEVFGSFLATLDNVIRDLTDDVNAGRVSSLDQLSKNAGEKAFIPAVMVFYAYSRLIDEQKPESAAPVPAPDSK